MAKTHRWPDDFDEMRHGEGCPMCASAGEEETPHGVRVFAGRWADATLARHPMRAGYTVVIFKGRHVAEPTELSEEEASGFWSEVTRVARAVEQCYRPMKMNWLSLGNGVPHLHVHLVPRPFDDERAGGPLEDGAFDVSTTPALSPGELRAQADELRACLHS